MEQLLKTDLFNVEKIRKDFPILHQQVYGKPLVYLDNAATTQKPRTVIDALKRYYEEDNSNIHRGVHKLSAKATKDYENVRKKVRNFLNAEDISEIIFVRGATEGINLVAQTYGRKNIGADDEILITHLEHHSNIVPWQLLCEEKGARLKVAPINDRGEVDCDQFSKMISPKTKFISVAYVSNALGTINPVKEIIRMAHEKNIPVLLDGAQAAPHLKVDMKELDCDFFVFSGHKIYGPTGIGILYGKRSFLEDMPPYQAGGDMIRSVTFEKTLYNALPYKYEAGTPNIAGTIGLGAAIDYVTDMGLENIESYEQELLEYGTQKIASVPGVKLIGTAAKKCSVISFLLGDIHPHDIGTILDKEGVAIRTGHHCAQPVMDFYKIPATSRASLAFYNTKEEFDCMAEALLKVKKVFG